MEIRDKAAVQAILKRTVEGYHTSTDDSATEFERDLLRAAPSQTLH
jgi:hypothetical protein